MASKRTSLATELAKAHHDLHHDLQALQDMALSLASLSRDVVHAGLDRVKRHLTNHFRFEEEGGYMVVVLERTPYLERKIEQLRDDHRNLMQALNALIEQARSADALSEGFGDEVRYWIQKVRAHENEENLVVEEAFNRDAPAED